MSRVKTVPLSNHIKSQIESICDAFGKGFDQAEGDLINPYAKDSTLHYAYEYGKQVAQSQPQNDT